MKVKLKAPPRPRRNPPIFETHPRLEEEWCTKLNTIDPSLISASFEGETFWKCRYGHPAWKASPARRTLRKQGCPYCSGNRQPPDPEPIDFSQRRKPARPRRGEALFDTDPELEREWSYEKNILDPDLISCWYRHKVWWKCCANLKHDDWRATPFKRTQRGQKCPSCTRPPLTETHTSLVKEWHPTKNDKRPKELTQGAHYKAWWVCPGCQAEYQARVYSRAAMGTGCARCRPNQSKQQLRIFVELQALIPETEEEGETAAGRIDIVIRSKKIAIEYDGGYWHDDKISADRRRNKILEERGWKVFRIRHNGLVKISQNDLPHNTRQAVSFDLMKALCDRLVESGALGPSFSEKLKDYIRGGQFIGETEYQDRLTKRRLPTDKETVADIPLFAQEWDESENLPMLAEHCSTGVDYKAAWICRVCCHKWRASVQSRIRNGHGCPACAGQCATTSRNLKVMFPELVSFLTCDEVDARLIAPFSGQEQAWACERCSTNFSRRTDRIVQRYQKSSKLPHCSTCMKVVRMGDKTLAHRYPQLAAQVLPEDNDGDTANDFTYGSEEKRTFTCSHCGHKRRVSPNKLTSKHRSSKCPNCKNDPLA